MLEQPATQPPLSAVAPDPRRLLLEFAAGWGETRPPSWSMDNDISKWSGITVDADGQVTGIVVRGEKAPRGCIASDMMRRLDECFPSLLVLDLFAHSLSGECRLDHLPPRLRTLALGGSHNRGGKLSGVLQFAALPRTLRELFLSHNDFCCPSAPEEKGEKAEESVPSLDWKGMPALERLHITYNRFTGGLDIGALPPSLRWLSLGYCRFSGAPLNGWGALASAVPQLKTLNLRNNDFAGTLDLNRDVPPTVDDCELDHNSRLQLICDIEDPRGLEWIARSNQFSCQGVTISERSSGEDMAASDLLPQNFVYVRNKDGDYFDPRIQSESLDATRLAEHESSSSSSLTASSSGLSRRPPPPPSELTVATEDTVGAAAPSVVSVSRTCFSAVAPSVVSDVVPAAAAQTALAVAQVQHE